MGAYDPGGLQDQKRSYPEMGSLIHTMYADFIKRVHKSQQNPERPPLFLFRRCCDSIRFLCYNEIIFQQRSNAA